MSYSVDSPDDAPETLTFGDSFMDIAAAYEGTVTVGMSSNITALWTKTELLLGLNRRLDNLSNTIAAAKIAKSKIVNLYAIELGNEPNCMLIPASAFKMDTLIALQSSLRAIRSRTVRPGLLPLMQHLRSHGKHP